MHTTTVTVSVQGEQKADFLLELLRALPYVHIDAIAEIEAVETSADAPDEVAKRTEEFLATAGIWAGRDIDARELRQRAWQRGNSGS